MSSIHDPRYIGLINCLIKIREERKVTQVQLASSLKKHQSYVAKIENLDRRIDLIELKDWLNALNIKFSEFIKFSNIENL
ncbi:DNA-binding protein [Acinetobacter lactucae]|jgi:transcriptional regulator with XRE-family HTH domain|uniref:Helix-turn-helix transcriptional regulator n=1 Tax=Acinetobacter pittii TaxID=48296 RepID=A0A6H0FTX7_ACIPI|nr:MULTISPECIES: helix-turn-helix transcriptional regulator [Acinetobacter calcoaceticus/baumannii complex]KYQ79711.1 DNA-binding protein [Acinetobacter lactucae]MCU4548656.1 helix-turn-helix transcriptional regulator [Acinetobacter pittii]MZY05505.1 helix-turn-helix domain-containing protein [Acinetobacter pittii]OCY34146.1 transcriptional regulator [Acinetobacter pittii]QIT17837.1 helix-turn-helix transcriptional regulator [Acinetobacter pittii]